MSSETASILNGLGKGPLDVRIRRLADERDDLSDAVRRLKLDLEEERQRGARLERDRYVCEVMEIKAFNQPRSCLVFLFSRALEFFSHLKFEDLTGFLKQPLYDVREIYDSPRILGLRLMQLVVCTTRFYFFCI